MTPIIAEQDLILNLKAAGFEGAPLREFIRCWKAGKTAEQLRILSRKRTELLDQVHREETRINCLDYLVYQIQSDKSL